MLGHLARVLRMLGFDTAYYRDEEDMHILARCLRERRILITSDRGLHLLAKGWGLGSVLAPSGRFNVWEFAEEVVRTLKLEGCMKPFTRCPKCNGRMVKIHRDELVGFVHPYVWNNHEYFAVCEECGQIYWEGSHVRRIRRNLRL